MRQKTVTGKLRLSEKRKCLGSSSSFSEGGVSPDSPQCLLGTGTGGHDSSKFRLALVFCDNITVFWKSEGP